MRNTMRTVWQKRQDTDRKVLGVCVWCECDYCMQVYFVEQTNFFIVKYTKMFLLKCKLYTSTLCFVRDLGLSSKDATSLNV